MICRPGFSPLRIVRLTSCPAERGYLPLHESGLRRLPQELREGALSLSLIGFRVLGPVEIVVGGRVGGPTTPQLRGVLAMLLVDEGRVVSAGRLISALWPSAPPTTAFSTIRVYISRLRKLLEGDPAVALATVGQGWRLDCDRERVDLYRFRALATRASESVEPEAARGLLREALGLWRGPAFADVAGDWLTDVIGAGLEDERLAAIEDRIALDLRFGAHQELVPELATLVAQDPLRERLVQMLMSALHRSGRTAEGLETYHRARRSLVEELGIEPGPELRDEYRRLLGAPLPERSLQVVPRQLPSGISAFAGRAGALADLDGLLSRPETGAPLLVTLNGLPGAGKTTLAVHWARSVVERFPEGSLYVNLRGFDPATPPVDPAEALRGFLDALGVPGRADPDRARSPNRRLPEQAGRSPHAGPARQRAGRGPGATAAAGLGRELRGRDQPPPAHRSGRAAGRPHPPRRHGRPCRGPRPAGAAAGPRPGPRRTGGGGADRRTLRGTAAVTGHRGRPRRRTGCVPLAAIADELDAAEPVLDAFESPDAAVDLRTVFSWLYRGLGPEAARSPPARAPLGT